MDSITLHEAIRNESCLACDLGCTANNVCMIGKGNLAAKLMIVGDYPTDSEAEDGDVMGSYKYKIFWNILEKAVGYKKEDCYFTYLVKCRGSSGEVPTDIESRACYDYLLQEIALIKPKAILTLSELALWTLTGQEGIGKVHGTIIEKEFELADGKFLCKVVPTYSPVFVERVQANFKNFALDIEKAVLIAQDIKVERQETIFVECDTIDKVKELITYVKQTKLCCFDFETDKRDDSVFSWDSVKPTCLSISFQHGCSHVIPLEHFETPFTQAEIDEIMELLRVHIFENREIAKINQNIKFDIHVLWFWKQIEVFGLLDDTMLMHHVLNSEARHGLKEFAPEIFKSYTGYELEVKKYAWDKVPLKVLIPYSGTDTDLTIRCGTLFKRYLLEDERSYLVYRNLQMFVFRPLMLAEREGMEVNRAFLLKSIKRIESVIIEQEKRILSIGKVKRFIQYDKERKKQDYIDSVQRNLDETVEKYRQTSKKIFATNVGKLSAKLADLKNGVIKIAYKGFNFGSPKQLLDLLYSKEGYNFNLPYVKKKKREAESTERAAIITLPDKTGFIDELLVLRSLEKIRGTYLQGILNRLDKFDKVHTTLVQIGTVTFRLSSKNPNMQNLPNISRLTNPLSVEAVNMVKKMFIAPEGYTFFQTDYSQAELRIIADYAQDTTMLEAYASDKDLHILTAANILNISEEKFKELDKAEQKTHRTRAKAGNFGFVYGMGEKSFIVYAKDNYAIDVSAEESHRIREAFFKTYKNLPDYYSLIVAKAKKFGYVRTLLGAKRPILDIYDSDDKKRGAAERESINTPIQGTAGQFTEFAIGLLYLRLDPKIKFVNTIHDSIQHYIPNELVEYAAPLIKNTCEDLPIEKYFAGAKLKSVNMKVDLESSTVSWKDLQPYEID